mmetsp:Transcript_4526/g.8051  ORF Transcript_4526/g.8051 Transcript_4526/m.8051 type:complete len:568 (-) Transcript_4526:330-2033(-)
MKPSPSTNKENNEAEEGSTVDVQQDLQQENRNGGCCNLNNYNNNHNNVINNNNNINMANKQQQQAWFQSSNKMFSRTEAYIEAQVVQLTEECRLFNEEDDSNGEQENSLALFQRHEIQTSWSLLGNGAFSEVYTIQNIRLLDGGFVDPVQQEAREKLQKGVNEGRMTLATGGSKWPQHQQYVVKHLRRDMLANRKKFIHAAGDLVLEAMYLSKLYHPNIITLFGCAVGGPNAYADGRHDGFFLILEKLDCTLSRRIQDWERLVSSGQCSVSARTVYSDNLNDFEEKLDIARQVGLALEYLHSRDIIFRDLKPDNIGLIDGPNGRAIVKLFDFGLCRELPDEKPHENKVFHMSGVGTRRYMAPEVFLGQYYNVKADVYSWSMVLHAMLSLQRPFEMYNAELHKLLVCQEGVRPTIFKKWPEQIQLLLKKSWAANPLSRPSMKEICSTIGALLDEIQATKSFASSEHNEPSVTRRTQEQQQGGATFMEQSIASFVESLTQSLCSGGQNAEGSGDNKRSKRSLLRTLEAHLVADAAGTQLLMMRDHHHPHFRDRVGADYPQRRHLRSGYL